MGEAVLSVSPSVVRLHGFGLHPGESGHDVPVEKFRGNPRALSAVEKFMGRRILETLLAVLERGESASWQNGKFSVSTRPVEICIGTEDRSGGTGTGWSVSDFLAHHITAAEAAFGRVIMEEIRGEIERLEALSKCRDEN